MTDADIKHLLSQAATLAPDRLERPSPIEVGRRQRSKRFSIGVAGVAFVGATLVAVPLPELGPDRLEIQSPAQAPANDVPDNVEQFLGTWRDPDGLPAERGAGAARTFEVRSHRLSLHCEWTAAITLQAAWPLGSTYAIGAEDVPVREYVRDPFGVLPDGTGGFRSGLQLQANMPEPAQFSGYAIGRTELWLGPDGGEDYAYLVAPDGVERWPRAFEHVACR